MKYELNNCIGLRLRRLSRIVDGYYRKNLIDYEITENQLTILFLLSEMKKVEQGRIGKVLKLERSTVSRNIKLLEKKGLIKRTPEYKPEIELTTKGKNIALELIPRWEKTMDELTAKLGDNGIQIIKKLEMKLV
ncbi:MAG: winged helix-turn-helix transcriptional regulator [Bacteroidetes bacterium]|nr:winged helix-turn-helix transcriptional regulator [Bacteroidota bacterium]